MRKNSGKEVGGAGEGGSITHPAPRESVFTRKDELGCRRVAPTSARSRSNGKALLGCWYSGNNLFPEYNVFTCQPPPPTVMAAFCSLAVYFAFVHPFCPSTVFSSTVAVRSRS